jgi:hypothetical protein
MPARPVETSLRLRVMRATQRKKQGTDKQTGKRESFSHPPKRHQKSPSHQICKATPGEKPGEAGRCNLSSGS